MIIRIKIKIKKHCKIYLYVHADKKEKEVRKVKLEQDLRDTLRGFQELQILLVS